LPLFGVHFREEVFPVRRFVRIWRGPLCLLLAACLFLGGTSAWQSLDQTARNDVSQRQTRFPVELVKRERKADGTYTEKPIAGAEFYLFTAAGTQVGGRYLTDENGKISVSLEPGSYYFQETYPGFGYTFDVDGAGQSVTRYPFTVTGKEETVVTVKAWNRPVPGQLTVTKTVKDNSGDPLTDAQREKVFTFTVTFSDGGTYPCRIDGGEERMIPSGGTFQLRHGQRAVFSGIPVGVGYTVVETPEADYTTFTAGSQGTIVAEGQTADFLNVANYKPPAKDPEIEITKVLVPSDGADRDKEFHFILTLNGVEYPFTLKPGESKKLPGPDFPGVELKYGDVYSIVETDEGYILTTDKASGTVALPIHVTFTNTSPDRPMVDIGGEKIWVMRGADGEPVIPPSIQVRLYGDGLLVEEKTVRPDSEGKWTYTFTAPKYDKDGREIVYTVREGPVDGFAPSYDDVEHDIVNTYVQPVTEAAPTLEKAVEGQGAPERQFEFVLEARDGAPLPNGATGSVRSYTLTGSGRVPLGTFTFTYPGTFVYTIRETAEAGAGWTYDGAVYELTYTVAEEDGKLVVRQRTLTRNGTAVDPGRLLFRNKYAPTPTPTPGGGDDDDDIRISGRKRWVNNSAPAGAQPGSIIVLVYADGEEVRRQEVTARDGWRYSFTLPKYDRKGHKITYTVGEKPVPGYELRVDGWDLVNTYVGETPPPTPTPTVTGTVTPTPTASTTPEPTPAGSPEPTPVETAPTPPPQGTGTPPPSVPKTGDTNELPIWLFVTVSGALGLLACLGYILWQKRRYVGKRVKKR